MLTKMWEKEKILLSSIFSFNHSIFNPFKELSKLTFTFFFQIGQYNNVCGLVCIQKNSR